MAKPKTIQRVTTTPEAAPEAPADDDFEFLPKKDLLRIDEAARYFSVSNRTINRWIGHSILESETVGFTVFGTRKSIKNCRFGRDHAIQG